MTGRVTVALRKKVDRIPLSIPLLKRTGGDPAFRDTGFSRLLYREKEIADTVHMMYRSIPTNVLADYATGKNDTALGLAITLALAPFGTVIEGELVDQFNESGDYAAREWSRDISRAWSRLGKEVIEDVTPSKLALGFRFDRASPAATKWAKQEAGKLVTDIIDSQKLAVRAVVQQAYTDGRTVSQTAKALVDILKEVAPTGDIGQMLAEQYAVNTAGLFPRYATAVANYTKKQAEILAKQGITGTKALETVTKRSQRYADKLRRSRAKMIARTEIMRANNQGKLESAYQAVNKGLIDPNTTKRQWSTAPMDVCDICAPENGVTVGMYESWSIGDPPAHPNCRCTWRLLPRANTYGVPQAQIYGPGGLGPGGPGIPSFTFPKLPDVPKVGAPVVNPLPPAEAPVPATPQSLPAQNMPGTAIADDVLPTVADDLTKPPAGLIEEMNYMMINVSWDDLTKPQQLALHNLSQGPVKNVGWNVKVGDIVSTILDEKGGWYDDAVDALAIRTVADDLSKPAFGIDEPEIEEIANIWSLTQGNDQQKADAVFEHLNFKGKPKVVEWEDLSSHVDESPVGEVRRVVRNVDQKNPVTGQYETLSKDEIAEQFRTGQHFTSEGIHGHGTYAYEGTAGAFDDYIAQRIGTSDEVTTVLEMTLTPDAKVIDMTSDLANEIREQYQYLFPDEVVDVNLVLAAKGFDAVRWVSGSGKYGKIVMILNRSKVIVGKEHGVKIGKLKSFPPKPPPPVPPASTIDDALPVNHPDNMFVSDVDEQVANLYQIIPVADDSIGYGGSIADGLNKLSLKAGPYKNSPHRLKFIDELAIMIEEEGNLSTVPAWLKEISLPPGMKKLSPQGFADARWRIGDYVKKGLLTADEADSFKALLSTMESTASEINLAGGFGSTVVSFQNKLIKFNQTLAQRLRANSTATGVKIPKNSLAGRFVDDQLAYAQVADNYLTKLDEFAPDAWEQLLPYGNFKHTIKNPPNPSDMGTYTPTVPVGAPKPKKEPKAWSKEPLDGTFRPQNPDDLPFAVDELIELKGESAVIWDRFLPLGGQHQKIVYADPTTKKMWIFKPQPKWQSELDRATSELQRRLGLQGAETHVVEIDGVIGSIQEVIGDQLGESTALFAGKTFDATKLSVAQIEQMQANYIFDHLISNYDSHAENFLRLKAAVDTDYLPIAVDKGQAFKHFGKTGEGLLDDWLFNPNNNAPSGNPLSLLFEQFAEGKGIPLQFMDDSERLQRMVRSIKDLADDGVLEDILMPYLIEAEKAGVIDSAMDMMDDVYNRWSGIFDSVRKLEDKLMKTVGGAARANVDDVLTSLALPPASAFIDSSVNWANKTLKPITDALSETQRRAVQTFTGSDYSAINNTILRHADYRGAKGLAGEGDFIRLNRRLINQIDKAMSPIEENVILYRNAGRISLPDGQIIDPANAVGKVLGDFGFQSTSVGKPVGMGNENVRLRMSVMKGVKGVWAKPISRHASENELLLQRGLRMIVAAAKKNGSQWELDVTVVPDDFKGIPEIIKQKATGKG